MTPGRWETLESLFHQARERTGAVRDAFLSSACGGDEALRGEVEELLAIWDSPQIDLGEHVKEAAIDFLSGPGAANKEIGSRIGPYRLLEQIGSGGMGAVYLAEREEQYEQKVALKLVDPALVRSPDILARFRFERQVLAQLNHPNIARLLDGGITQQGVPYLVMEYVDGSPIDRYAEQHALSTRQRIDLFREVCQAVAHAHQSLVVHRDIKPGNILVTADGIPKLLDFGIAKALQADRASLTQTRERLLTPGYASPEQIKGEPVTTATDVYALGALLFELLTGKRLFDAETRTPFELEIAICEQQPARPSSLAPMDADLDAIILKSLRKEPAKRYASVTALDEDLRRHLEGYAVEARKGGWRYGAGKFARRHRVAIAAAALMAATLVWGGISIRRAQIRAERRFAEVRELTNQFLFHFNDAIADIPGATKARSMVVERAIVYLDRLAAESSGDTGLQTELAKGYERLRDIRFEDGYPSVGDTARAIDSANKAIRLWEEVVAARPNDLHALASLADSHRKLGHILSSARNQDDARPHMSRATDLYERCVKRSPTDNDLRLGLAEAYFGRGDLERSLGNVRDARAYIAKAIAIREDVLKTDHSARNLYGLATDYLGFGDIDRTLTLDMAKAESSYNRGLALAEESLRLAPQGEQQLRTLAIAHQRLAIMYIVSDRPKDALPHCEATLALNRSLMEKDPANPDYVRGVRSALNTLGNALERSGDLQSAIKDYQQAIGYSEKVIALDPSNLRSKAELAVSVHLLGTALGKVGDEQGSRAALERAVALREPVARVQPDNVDLQERLAVNYLALGLWHARAKDCGSAGRYYGKSSDIFSRLKAAQRISGYGVKQYARVQDSAKSCTN